MVGTRHFLVRAAQRGLTPSILEFVLAFGTPVSRAGAQFVTVRERDLPPGVDRSMAERAERWVIVVARDGTPLTCYKRADATRYIRRKSKRSARARRPRLSATGYAVAG